MTYGSRDFNEMSDPTTNERVTGKPSAPSKPKAQGVRYSLNEMLEEVVAERQHSAVGRELLDATEIGKMFADKRNRKRRQK